MKIKTAILAAFLIFTSACDGDPKVNACVMAFDQELACHNSKVSDACFAICDEIYDICVAADDPEAYNQGCGEGRSYCSRKCWEGFRPDDPTSSGAYPNRTDSYYYLESCATPDEQRMICSDLTAP